MAARSSAIALCCLLLQFRLGGSQEITVRTSLGLLKGEKSLVSGDWNVHACEQWRGVPYAKPPTGERRFASAVAWDEAYPAEGRQAKHFGSVCPQMSKMGSGDQVEGDEDCLSLNVWRPENSRDDEKLAVMVYFYGGSFVFGSGNQPGIGGAGNVYRGCGLAGRHGVIVVNMNYRLGSLGFSALRNADGSVSANAGLSDQREALRWVQREIAHFGGDPEKVTIFGESAGAISVMHHLVSPLSLGLFRGAISESGMPLSFSTEFGLLSTRNYAAHVGCSAGVGGGLRECLQKKSVEELIVAEKGMNPFTQEGWGPVVDGVELPEPAMALWLKGKSAKVPLIAGTNTDEGNLFVYPHYRQGMSDEQLRDFAREVFSKHGARLGLNSTDLEKVFAMYPPTDGENRVRAAGALGDATFTCRTQEAALEHGKRADTFHYRYNHRLNCADLVFKWLPGVFHGMELPMVFGTPADLWCGVTDEEGSLTWRMQTMWTNFAKHLNPTPQGPPGTHNRGQVWPKYDAGHRRSLVMDTTRDSIEESYKAERCGFWSHLLYSRDLEAGPSPSLFGQFDRDLHLTPDSAATVLV